MTDYELLRRYELLKEVTEGLVPENAEKVIKEAVTELVCEELKNKATLSRHVYETIGGYIKDCKTLTLGQRVKGECEELAEKYTELITPIEFDILFVNDNPVEFCSDIAFYKEKLPQEVVKSKAFDYFIKRVMLPAIHDDDVYRPAFMYEKDFERIKKEYSEFFEMMHKASCEYLRSEGYYSIRRKVKKIWDRYEKLSEKEKAKVIQIKIMRTKKGASGRIITFSYIVDVLD